MSAGLDATFLALSDPTRRAILARLASGEATVSDLTRPFSLSQPAISKHLKVLERAGLVVVAKDAQRRPRRLNPAPLAEVSAWLEQYREAWEANFQHLDDLLAGMQAHDRAGAPPRRRASRTSRRGRTRTRRT